MQLASRIFAVVNSDAGAGEEPFAEVKDLTADLINKLQSEDSSKVNAGEDSCAEVKKLITDSINWLQSAGNAGENPFADMKEMDHGPD